MGKVYMFYDHFNNYWVNLCADARFFLSLKFRKFYLLKTRFLVIFKCHLGALRVFFEKMSESRPPKKSPIGFLEGKIFETLMTGKTVRPRIN